MKPRNVPILRDPFYIVWASTGRLLNVERIESATHIDFHALVQAIMHDQTVSQSDSERLHRMPELISVVANSAVIEICYLLLLTWWHYGKSKGRLNGLDWTAAGEGRSQNCSRIILYVYSSLFTLIYAGCIIKWVYNEGHIFHSSQHSQRTYAPCYPD
jgi:hypothetical protein